MVDGTTAEIFFNSSPISSNKWRSMVEATWQSSLALLNNGGDFAGTRRWTSGTDKTTSNWNLGISTSSKPQPIFNIPSTMAGTCPQHSTIGRRTSSCRFIGSASLLLPWTSPRASTGHNMLSTSSVLLCFDKQLCN